MRSLFAVVLVLLSSTLQMNSQSASGHYLFAWTGADAGKGNDFLAVIDADPSSPSYGHLVTTVATDQKTEAAHHTEYTMPASGMLFANDHYAGRTFIFDVRDPQHPRVASSFTDMAGYMHPHSYLRLPNGHVLSSFQHAHSSMDPESLGKTGGLVEIDDSGKVIRSVSNADPAFSNALLTPYSLVVVPELDRVVSTNSSMHDSDLFRGLTYQFWRLSDLKLLKTAYFDTGDNHYAQISPENRGWAPMEPSTCKRLPAASSASRASIPISRGRNWSTHFPVPSAAYRPSSATICCSLMLFCTQSLCSISPTDRSQWRFHASSSTTVFSPHWSGWDEKTGRIVVTDGGAGKPGLFLLKFDSKTGAIAMDEAFRDADGKPGFNFVDREWPHGWKGSGRPHGAVFSR